MTFRWLHLSDTHFREDELWDRRATLRALIEKVRELKEKGLAPDMVFVTGDIAWSGKAKEYEQASRFFHELNKVLELDPKDRWFLVPGNHDVARSQISRSHRAIQAGLTDETIVEETLRDPDSMRLLSTRLEAYYSFAADFLGAARTLQPDRPWRTDVREFGGTSVGILQLNSVWIAEGGKADEANLLVGEAQVREALDATPDAFLRIALMHHPLRNLRDFDENRVGSLLGAKGGAAFLLRGHLHLNRTRVQSSPDGSLFEIAAGALYTDETNFPRGFHMGEVDLDKGEARIHLFRYSIEGNGFFAPDNLTYENAPNGICKVRLPAGYRLGGKKTKPAKTISEDQRRSFTARYRNAAAAYHGHARFVGFPNQATRPNARVSELFVPLRLRRREERENTELRTTAEIARFLLGPPISFSERVIVTLGDPGSGKTTLSRFLVMLAAGVITMPNVELAGEPLPLRIAFREFVERQRENPNLSLLDYLEMQAKAELSLALPKNFLARALEEGHAIVLLDGLDEVGAPEHRVAMRDLVAGFSAVYPKVPMLITSRIAGYDDAPLGQTVETPELAVTFPFDEFVLEKFNDDDLRTFVTHWYSVQEPADPVARDRGIGDLIAALNADERVRELARTPILATLIAMIHRVEANLPGERAKLYDLCVRMLLETWPAQAKRPFAEIDPGLQRAYLESLAFAMQIGRSDSSGEAVTITRSDLLAKFLLILRKRDFANEPEEKIAGVIERWIDHLEKHSGILVEQSTNLYAFFHLSIMEYLAAQGMERELGRDNAIATIGPRFRDAVWRDVCLLAVGSHAEDGDFLDAVYKRVGKSTNSERWDFLLRCLREEARFRPEQRETILDRYAAMVLESGFEFTDPTLINQIQRFSIRHGEAVQHWIEDRLDHALGDDLASASALTTTLVGRLADRPDRAEAAEALLEFWPNSALGDWAAGAVDAKAALGWSHKAPQNLALPRAAAALSETPELLAAFSLIALNMRTLQSCLTGNEGFARVSKLSRPGGRGLPNRITVEPGRSALVTRTRAPRDLPSRVAHVPPRSVRVFARLSVQSFTRGFATDFARQFGDVSSHDFAFDFANFFAREFGSDFDSDFASNIANRFADAFADAFSSASIRDFAHYYSGYFSGHVRSNFGNHFVGNYTNSEFVPHRTPTQALRGGMSKEEAQSGAENALAEMLGETWISFATMAKGASDEERLEYFLLRRQNRWLFEVWSGIDHRLPENPSPAQLALYFALGWAQSTTTWAWPDSDRWRTLFAAGPGEHWLVRSQWHLCKLTDDPSSKEDDAELRAALRDGHSDESLPGYAARLSEVLGIEA